MTDHHDADPQPQDILETKYIKAYQRISYTAMWTGNSF